MSRLTEQLATAANSVLHRFGLRLVRHEARPVEFDDEDAAIVEAVLDRRLTMASPERLFSTLLACRHVCRAGVEGDFVECGVWRGGNSIVAADVFRRQSPDRRVFLFDTFAGMTEPTADDFGNRDRKSAMPTYLESARDSHNEWCYASMADVETNLAAFRVPASMARLVRGDVLATLSDPVNLPEKISVLRLDTDWYESTRRELEVLWPRLELGGVLIVDDYGHWGGAKKAVDEFFDGPRRPLLTYTDYTGRVAVKTAD